MKKLSDYKTKEERIAHLIVNECMANDELWKMPLKDTIYLICDLAELARQYLDGEKSCNESTGGQMFDLLKKSASVNDEYKESIVLGVPAQYAALPRFNQDKTEIEVGNKFRVYEKKANVIEVNTAFEGCCSNCFFNLNKYDQYPCTDCAGVYFKKIYSFIEED